MAFSFRLEWGKIQSMYIEVSDHRIVAKGPAIVPFAGTLALRLEGRKKWLSHNELVCERSQHNLSILKEISPDCEIVDRTWDSSILKAFESATNLDPISEFVMEPRKFQLDNFHRFKNKDQFAIFSDQGTGKTKVAIDILCHRYLKGSVTGAIILSSPKGVHSQWINDQLPKHLWPSVKVHTYIWGTGKPPESIHRDSEKLQIISGNIDMVKSSKGAQLLKSFAAHHRDRLMILVDESDSIKNIRSRRSVKLRDLAVVTRQRAIMTGTPIAKDLTDEWAQFYFLNPDIIGHKYLTSFRAQYCVMGGFENRSVVAHKNVANFKQVTAPFIFRARKSELNLPEKIYDSVTFDLSDTQRRMIKEIRDQFFTSLSSGETMSVRNGAVALMRIQQISNGFMVDENENIIHLEENPRLDAAIHLRSEISGPTIIWCRFREDIRILAGKLNASIIWGEDKNTNSRDEAKRNFLSGKVETLLATPGSAGRGMDGLQTICSDAIYYSNSYSSIDRYQSEDRIHRIGMKGTASYFDLIGIGSIDRAILRNLKQKRDLSAFILGDIKQIMEELEL